MGCRRVFVGWDKPISQVVAEYVMPVITPPAVELQHLLVVVPTRQAGRRLRDAMTLRADAEGAALLSPQVVPPTQISSVDNVPATVANGAEQLSVWISVLRDADADSVRSFLPAIPEIRDTGWCIRTAKQLMQLRGALADGGFGIADVALLGAGKLSEPDRWREMAALEQRYLELLSAGGLDDLQQCRISLAVKPIVPDEVRRIVVAAVSDPSLLTVRALEALAETHDVEILVQAPPSLADLFDSWGRPIPSLWESRPIPLEGESTRIVLSADPGAQASECRDVLSASSARWGAGECAIGVPDRSVVSSLRDALLGIGVSSFDPQDLLLRDHVACRLTIALLELYETGTYRALAALLRHPDFLSAEKPVSSSRAEALLTQLDQFQNRYLPLRLKDISARFVGNPSGSDSKYLNFSLLGEVLSWVESWIKRLSCESVPLVVRSFLQEVYGGRSLQPVCDRDSEFIAAAESLDSVLREVERLQERMSIPADTISLLRARMQDAAYHCERGDEWVDLEGWLELSWNDAPHMIVSGMNEGAVPDGCLSDLFLPDSLRHELGLRDDRMRLARDAHLLTCLAEQRRRDGALVLVCGKRSESGDLLKSSRLLFRCPDEILVSRARLLFGEISSAGNTSPVSISFKLDPARVEDTSQTPDAPHSGPVLKKLSVTDFGQYLRCPFRFYLRRILGMEPLNDDQTEPDARVYGTLVHDILDFMGSDRALWASDDADTLGNTLTAELDRMMRNSFGSRPPMTVIVSRDSAEQRLRRLACEQVQLYRDGWDILNVEKRYEMVRGQMTVVGRIDRIDRHRESGRLRVLDYKTTDKAWNPSDKHLVPVDPLLPEYTVFEGVDRSGRTRVKRWADLQLPLYRLMLTAAGVEGAGDAELGYFAVTAALADLGVKVWESYSDLHHASAVKCVDGVIAGIQQRRFWPPLKMNPEYDDFRYLLPGDPSSCLHYEPLCGEGHDE